MTKCSALGAHCPPLKNSGANRTSTCLCNRSPRFSNGGGEVFKLSHSRLTRLANNMLLDPRDRLLRQNATREKAWL